MHPDTAFLQPREYVSHVTCRWARRQIWYPCHQCTLLPLWPCYWRPAVMKSSRAFVIR